MRLLTRCLLPLLAVAAPVWAQGYNSVPLGHAAYDVIEIGIIRGIVQAPPSAKPWTIRTVTEALQIMANDSVQVLSPGEIETVTRILDSLERKSFGFGWESVFSMRAPNTLLASANAAHVYAEGNLGEFLSWNVTAAGEFLYIERDEQGSPPVFAYNAGKIWDGGVLSLRNPGAYAAWPDDPSLAFGVSGEMNFVSGNTHLRIGRIRRDWGLTTDGASLFMNAQARPLAAIEGTISALSWMNISFLGGAMERYRENSRQPKNEPFTNMLALAQIEFTPPGPFRITAGGAAALFRQFNGGFFTGLELRLPGYFSLWGSLFIDNVDFPLENFSIKNSNSYSWQAGIKAPVRWLPFAVFSLRYTKIEPYCYTRGMPSPGSLVNGGESLGYYLPPNSDELLLRVESMFLPDVKAFVQYQMIRRGADYGYGAVGGSSLNDSLTGSAPQYKYFLMDGVYKWDNIIKIGCAYNLKAGIFPLAVFAEIGFLATRFTINGTAGVGNEAEYEQLDDPVYRAGNGFIFSIGFRLFP